VLRMPPADMIISPLP